MRALDPRRTGIVGRDGVAIHFEVYGEGSLTMLLVPPSPITHSRIWKAQIPHLARRFRVVTFDGRGNGRSTQPSAPDDHRRSANVADMVAVLDATDTDAAIIVAHCHANWWAVDLATAHPSRVRALIAISPGVPVGESHLHWSVAAETWDQVLDDPEGWQLFNRHVITDDHRRWIEFFFGSQLVEPHSTKAFEDAVDWALESTGAVLAASEEAPDLELIDQDQIIEQVRNLRIPVLVVHGDQDVCQHVDRGRAVAELTGAELVVVEGAGHLVHLRDPVRVNRAITNFVSRVEGDAMKHHTWTRGASRRRRRVLYASSPIGLGHARRDLAIAEELRQRDPDLEIEWLAQHPVTTVLEAAGETIHPASAWLASESAHMASEAAGHDLHCFQALRNMDEILVANFMVFQEVVEDGLYDLVIGDEAWDIDHFWHENPELKRGEHVWLTDFVGFLPMSDGGAHEAHLTADYNAEMIEHIERFPRIRDRSIFVGNPDDIVPETFGPGLPKIRDWTEQHFAFCGYITGFDPPTDDQRAEWRSELGYGEDELVCVVTVGGSGVGRDLLGRAIDAFPLAERQVPGLRMVAVAGPRIDPTSLPTHPGLEVHGYVDRLYRHLAVCDLAVVQGGLTTTMELTAANRPFLYFPLSHHFEQNFHVRHRLDQYGAGTHMEYASTDPDALAEAIAANVGRPVATRPVETDGARRAAALIAELL